MTFARVPPRLRARRSCARASARAAQPAPQLRGLDALLAGREAFDAGVKDLLAPAPQQRLRDVVLAAQLGDRLLAAPARHHQLELLLRRELPVLPFPLAQRVLQDA